MSYRIVTDTSANLPLALLGQPPIDVVPLSFGTGNEAHTCLDIEAFDGEGYYASIRKGAHVTTSQINPQCFIDCFLQILQSGQDVLYVGMSSGISGTNASARLAAEELAEHFPARRICVVDTLSASLGEGLIVLEAMACRRLGMTLSETEEKILSLRHRMCQVFTVDDLMHLRRSGRITNITALAGTVLSIKPLLLGDAQGRIVTYGRTVGRRRALEALAERYDALAVDPQQQTIGIAHGGCPADAARLSALLRRNRPPREILSVCYEPVTGAHVGPGALALFFLGAEDVRQKR